MSIRKGKPTELLQGTLDLLILNALAHGALHGLAIAHRIEQITNGAFEVKPGSLFPALHGMEEASWLVASWGESRNGRKAKFYRLTKAGLRQLEKETSDWRRVSRRTFWLAHAAKNAGLHGCRGRNARTQHWRQYRHLQPGERRSPPSASVS